MQMRFLKSGLSPISPAGFHVRRHDRAAESSPQEHQFPHKEGHGAFTVPHASKSVKPERVSAYAAKLPVLLARLDLIHTYPAIESAPIPVSRRVDVSGTGVTGSEQVGPT